MLRSRFPGLARPGIRGFHHSFRRFEQEDVEKIKTESSRGEKDHSPEVTGVIDKTSSEVVLYYDHIYPWTISTSKLKSYLQWCMVPMKKRFKDDRIKEKIKSISGPLPEGSFQEFIPMKRDCGAFVKFEVPPNMRPSEFIRDVQHHVDQHRAEYTKTTFHKITNLLWNHFPTVYPVQGTPWIEDLRRFPSRILKIKFEGPALTEEEMYVLFRRYGPIVDIVPDPTVAKVTFQTVRSAICGKNCMTGIVLDGNKSVLHIQYEPEKRINYITNFINTHQKIAIPIIIALLAGLATILFDPIREFFIEAHITKKYSIEKYKDSKAVQLLVAPFKLIERWVFNSYAYIDETISTKEDIQEAAEAEKTVSAEEKTSGDTQLWVERYQKARDLRLWIHENINTFIIVHGPKGSGKEEFVVDEALRPDDTLSKDLLVIDCESLNKARSETELLKMLASQVGYFPLFTWTNTVSQFIDLGVQGITGAKSGLSESMDTRVKQMFSLTSQAMRSIVGDVYSRYVKLVTRHNRRLGPNEPPVEIVKQDQYLQHHPEQKPIVVIDNFVRNPNRNTNDFLYSVIAEWAASLIQNNLAHVIIITNDMSTPQSLSEALPDTVFKSVTLNDASLASAEQFLRSQLPSEDLDRAEIKNCLVPLGGRMIDLQAFVRRNKSGESPQKAITEMTTQAAEQVSTFFINKVSPDWNSAQIWVIMKHLAESDRVLASELAKDPVFAKADETYKTLLMLERHDLVSLEMNLGVLSAVATGRPLYRAAFKMLVSNPSVFKLYETDYLKRLISIETDKISTMETELQRIFLTNVDKRKHYLSNKIEASTQRITELEEQIKTIGKPKERKTVLGISI